jgi:predicted RNase H-like nuclease (RuvC/YqgF family)
LCKLQTLPHLGRLCLSIERTFNKNNKLKKEEKDKYLNGLFIPPKPTEKENKLNCNFCKKDKIEKDIIFNKTSCNSKMNKSHMKLKKEKMSMNLEIYNLKREIVNLTKKLDKYQEKIGQLNTRNVNKRIKHRNVKIQKLTEQNKKLFDRQKYLQKLICRIRQKNK